MALYDPDADIPQINRVLGTSAPAGQVQVNGMHPDKIYSKFGFIDGDLYVMGCIKTPYAEICNGFVLKEGYVASFPDGDVLHPSITFTKDLDTGFYRVGSGEVGFTSNGTETLSMDTQGIRTNRIGTLTGDLVLAPTGSNIDCSNKNLINVANWPTGGGGGPTNANQTDVFGSATTTDATPTNVISTTLSGSGDASFLAKTRLSIVNSSTGTDSATYELSVKAKQIGGVITLSSTFSTIKVLDASLANIDVSYSQSGTNLLVVVTGLAGTTIKWFAYTQLTRQLF